MSVGSGWLVDARGRSEALGLARLPKRLDHSDSDSTNAGDQYYSWFGREESCEEPFSFRLDLNSTEFSRTEVVGFSEVFV